MGKVTDFSFLMKACYMNMLRVSHKIRDTKLAVRALNHERQHQTTCYDMAHGHPGNGSISMHGSSVGLQVRRSLMYL